MCKYYIIYINKGLIINNILVFIFNKKSNLKKKEDKKIRKKENVMNIEKNNINENENIRLLFIYSFLKNI